LQNVQNGGRIKTLHIQRPSLGNWILCLLVRVGKLEGPILFIYVTLVKKNNGLVVVKCQLKI
jgi:hypothetical protein